jgi:hypothetical protein
MTEREDALLHAAIDGELTGDERIELNQLLARSDEARGRFQSLQHLVGMVEELGSAAVPDDLSAAVANIVWNDRATVGAGGLKTKGDAFMARKVLMGLAAAAAVVLVTFSITGYPPAGKGTQGTIGQAQRYEAAQPQMSANDVKLGDTAVQQFMQTDVFDRLLKDDTARKLLSDASVRQALGNPALIAALHDGVVVQLLNDKVFVAFLASDAAGRLLKNDVIAHALADEGTAQALIGAAKVGVSSPGMIATAARNDAALTAALRDPAIVAALRSEAVQRAVGSGALMSALKVDAVRQALSADAIQHAVATGLLQQALASDAFAKALNTAGFVAAMPSAQFAAALAR